MYSTPSIQHAPGTVTHISATTVPGTHVPNLAAYPGHYPSPPVPGVAAATPPGPVAGAMVREMTNAAPRRSLVDSVVKIYAVTKEPDYLHPWQFRPQRDCTGTGFVIVHAGQKQILTNAHVVANSIALLVRKHGSPKKYAAHMLAVGHESDLALVQVDDAEFWTDLHALEFAADELPHLQDHVAVAGFPIAGDNVSLTTGVVSRIEIVPYSHGGTPLAAVVVDAAINPGSSGGPAVRMRDERVVGVAFQAVQQLSNVAHLIPAPIVRRFLADVKRNGTYTGVCSLAVLCQPLENDQLRKYLKMTRSESGILVSKVMKLGCAHGLVRRDDVITHIDGVPVANDGTVPLRGGAERIPYEYLLSRKLLGDQVKLRLARGDKRVEVSVTLTPAPRLVRSTDFDMLPPYSIVAGLVFLPLSQSYLEQFGNKERQWWDACPKRLLQKLVEGEPACDGHELVVLSQVLADDVNQTYQALVTQIVDKVNGVEIKSLDQMQTVVDDALASTSEFLRIDMDSGMVIVLSIADAKKANARILKRHRVPSLKGVRANFTIDDALSEGSSSEGDLRLVDPLGQGFDM